MIFSPFNHIDYRSSVRIQTRFEYGDPGSGSGFLVKKDTTIFLVTARHLIGDNHKQPQEQARTSLTEVSVTVWLAGTSAGAIQAQNCKLKNPVFQECASDNDLAAFAFAQKDAPEGWNDRIAVFDYSDLADEAQLSDYTPGGPVFICGYPAASPNLDGCHSYLPLVRQGIFATPPKIRFPVGNKLGSDYFYIDSFALGGFSGCMVIAPQCGLPPSSGLDVQPNYPRRIVGMLVGRLNTSEEKTAGEHSGLSYLVSSVSIRNLIDSIGAQ